MGDRQQKVRSYEKQGVGRAVMEVENRKTERGHLDGESGRPESRGRGKERKDAVGAQQHVGCHRTGYRRSSTAKLMAEKPLSASVLLLVPETGV